MMASLRSRWAFLARPHGGEYFAVTAFVAILTFLISAEAVFAQAVPIPDPEPAGQQAVGAPVTYPEYGYRAAQSASSPAKPATKAPSSPVVSAAPGPGQFSIHMNDGTCLVGVFGETKAVPFEAVFGKIEIPMASIRTVDFGAVINGAKTHRVHFTNGDSLTGSVGRIAPVKFTTSYGVLVVPMDQVTRLSGPVSQLPSPAVELAATPAPQPIAQAGLLVPIPDAAPPGPIRPATGVIVPDDEVR